MRKVIDFGEGDWIRRIGRENHQCPAVRDGSVIDQLCCNSDHRALKGDRKAAWGGWWNGMTWGGAAFRGIGFCWIDAGYCATI